MKRNNFRIIVVICLFASIVFGPKSLYSQSETEYLLKITQQILPSGTVYRYEINNQEINVLKLNDKDKALKVYSRKIGLEDKDSIQFYISSIAETDYDTVYSEPVLDGISWHFELLYENEYKSIRLDNFYIETLDGLISKVNKLLPKKRRYINLRLFYTKD